MSSITARENCAVALTFDETGDPIRMARVWMRANAPGSDTDDSVSICERRGEE